MLFNDLSYCFAYVYVFMYEDDCMLIMLFHLTIDGVSYIKDDSIGKFPSIMNNLFQIISVKIKQFHI